MAQKKRKNKTDRTCMRHRKSKESTASEYDPTIWQFQLVPISEMDIDELIAMDAYYRNPSYP